MKTKNANTSAHIRPNLFHASLVLLGACLPLSALANGGGYVTGVASTGAFKPLGLQNVEMLAEKLEIDLHLEYADVTINYVLHNTGPKVTVEAGFPCAIAWERNDFEEEEPKKKKTPPVAKLDDFSLTADGKAVAVTVKPDALKLPKADDVETPIEVKAWHIFKLTFDKEQTRKVQVHYRSPYYGSYSYVSEDERIDPLRFTYLFSSAAAWQGPIVQGTVIVRAVTANPEWVQFNHAKRFQREGNVWTWNFKDFEPTLEDDLVITTRPAYFGTQQTLPKAGTDGETDYLPNTYVGWNAKMDFEKDTFGGVWELQRRDYTAKASSTLPPNGETNYDPKNLGSNEDESIPWVEGVKGDGIGESVTLTLAKPANVKRVGLVNGYAKSTDLYLKNNRIAELDVSVNDGTPFKVTVPDEQLKNEKFYFDLPGQTEPVKSVKLTIGKVYKGTKYDDTCLTEVVLVVPLEKEPKVRPAR